MCDDRLRQALCARAERMAYQRGYQNAASRKWPAHCPPYPPDRVVMDLMASVTELRNAYDSICAAFGPDDPLAKSLDPAIERADTAMRRVTEWLRKPDDAESLGGEGEG